MVLIAVVLALLVQLAGCTGNVAPGAAPPRDPASDKDSRDHIDPPPSDQGPKDPVAATCDARQVPFVALKTLSAREYANTLRDIFAGAGIPADKFPTPALDGRLDVSAQTLERIDADARPLLKIALASTQSSQSWIGCALGGAGDDPCRETLIRVLGLRIFRRPLHQAEVEELTALFDTLVRQKSLLALDAAGVVVRAMLQAPEFLYHFERNVTEPADAAVFAISDHALASRLSYFLWQSSPDAELFAAAADGRLREANGLAAQIARMLADERAVESLTDWFESWLGIAEMDHVSKDEKVYPEYDAALRDEMRAESRRFFQAVLREGGGQLPLLFNAPFTFTTPRLSALYGVPHAASGVQRITLDERQRAGVLTHASVLTTHGASFGSHPVKRGLLVRTHLLCQAVPPPPADVDTSIKVEERAAAGTTRAIFEAHTRSPSCSSCHKLIDPIGFAFEHYDGIGRYRQFDGAHPVDASAELINTDIDGRFTGAVELAKRLAHSKKVAACAVTRVFERAHGRVATAEDDCRIAAIANWLAEDGGGIPALVARVLTEPSLRYRAGGSAP
jgi:hypothetical protein